MKATIGDAIGLTGGNDEINLLECRIDALNKEMMELVNASVMGGEGIENHEDEFRDISQRIEQLNRRIEAIQESDQSNVSRQERIEMLQKIIEERNLNQDQYDDSIVRQMIECIKVYEDGKLTIIFGGGYEIEKHI